MSFKTRPEKIMVFVEANEESITAAQYAVCLARWLNCELYAVYVVDVKTLHDLLKAKIFVEMEEMDYQHDLEEDGRRYLNYVRDLAESKGVHIYTDLLKGDVVAEIQRKVEEIDVDLLVMGKLEEPESRRDFYYNDGERIFRRTPCPAIMVKEDEPVRLMYDQL
ncbi:MAG: universal stress protein [Candidatus Auribacterota bacterium]|jgi:nucleotide-binding universal stress UspA family protein|nr:universal stress protein [Candidatus Auribacterota bacterium]